MACIALKQCSELNYPPKRRQSERPQCERWPLAGSPPKVIRLASIGDNQVWRKSFNIASRVSKGQRSRQRIFCFRSLPINEVGTRIGPNLIRTCGVGGWLHRQQAAVIEYLNAENRRLASDLAAGALFSLMPGDGLLQRRRRCLGVRRCESLARSSRPKPYFAGTASGRHACGLSLCVAGGVGHGRAMRWPRLVRSSRAEIEPSVAARDLEAS